MNGVTPARPETTAERPPRVVAERERAGEGEVLAVHLRAEGVEEDVGRREGAAHLLAAEEPAADVAVVEGVEQEALQAGEGVPAVPLDLRVRLVADEGRALLAARLDEGVVVGADGESAGDPVGEAAADLLPLLGGEDREDGVAGEQEVRGDVAVVGLEEEPGRRGHRHAHRALGGPLIPQAVGAEGGDDERVDGLHPRVHPDLLADRVAVILDHVDRGAEVEPAPRAARDREAPAEAAAVGEIAADGVPADHRGAGPEPLRHRRADISGDPEARGQDQDGVAAVELDGPRDAGRDESRVRPGA